MKKMIRFAAIFFIAAASVQCSSDDNDSNNQNGLFVNGVEYQTFANGNSGDWYNTMFSMDNENIGTTAFTMVVSDDNLESLSTLMVTVVHEGSFIPGTFQLKDENDQPDPSQASFAFLTFENDQGVWGETSATGSVKISANGNNNYKIQFNNNQLGSSAGSTVKVSGYVKEDFAVMN